MNDEVLLTVRYDVRGAQYRIISRVECLKEFVAEQYPIKVVHPRNEPDIGSEPEITEPVRGVLF
jgi:hypothetical protein